MLFRLALLVAFAAVAVSGLEGRTKPHPMDGKRQAGIAPGMKEIVVIDGKIYFFGLWNYMNWYEAQILCSEMGMQMLELDDEAKSDTMIQWLFDNPDYDYWSWIGLRREIGNETFFWESTGAEPTYTGWGPGKPSDPLTEPTCADITGFYDGWDDDNCEIFGLSVICEEIAA